MRCECELFNIVSLQLMEAEKQLFTLSSEEHRLCLWRISRLSTGNQRRSNGLHTGAMGLWWRDLGGLEETGLHLRM